MPSTKNNTEYPVTRKKRASHIDGWWEHFNTRRVLTDEFLTLSMKIAAKHRRLSEEYVYSLVMEVVRRLHSEFSHYGYSARSEVQTLRSIDLLQQILDHERVFSYAQCESDNIITLSKLNVADLDTLKWFLSDPRCMRVNRLPPAKGEESFFYSIITFFLSCNYQFIYFAAVLSTFF